MKDGKLNGKVAVVTGASKGIGAGIAKRLAAEGAAVVVNYASAKTDADKVVDEITKRGGKAVAVQGNVAKKAEVERLFRLRKKRSARSTSWSITPGSMTSCRSNKSPRSISTSYSR